MMTKSSNLDDVDPEYNKLLYSEACGLFRHYGNLRFACISAVLLINFAVLNLYTQSTLEGIRALAVAALVSTVALFMFELSINREIGAYKRYARSIEKNWGGTSFITSRDKFVSWLGCYPYDLYFGSTGACRGPHLAVHF